MRQRQEKKDIINSSTFRNWQPMCSNKKGKMTNNIRNSMGEITTETQVTEKLWEKYVDPCENMKTYEIHNFLAKYRLSTLISWVSLHIPKGNKRHCDS